jgi:hypothetical protein
MEMNFLQRKFSSGISLRELCSVAVIAATFAKISPPRRDSKRNRTALVQWFHSNWSQVLPFLVAIELRDTKGVVVDGIREIIETTLP